MLKSIKISGFALLLLSAALNAAAQKKITQGTITYTVTHNLTEAQKAKTDIAKLPLEWEAKFNDSLSSTKIKRGSVIFDIISNHRDKTRFFLIDMVLLGRQYGVKQSKEEVSKLENKPSENIEFKETKETQIIAGYQAHKYLYTDNKGVNREVWATKEVVLPSFGIDKTFQGLNAVPLKYTVLQTGIETTRTLKSIVESNVNIPTSIPDEYELTTMEEITKMNSKG